jgi:hypothetical protein
MNRAVRSGFIFAVSAAATVFASEFPTAKLSSEYLLSGLVVSSITAVITFVVAVVCWALLMRRPPTTWRYRAFRGAIVGVPIALLSHMAASLPLLFFGEPVAFNLLLDHFLKMCPLETVVGAFAGLVSAWPGDENRACM